MRLPDHAVLEEGGLTLYERKALIALTVFGVADAAALCREGGVPTSKIYLAMENLAVTDRGEPRSPAEHLPLRSRNAARRMRRG